MSIPAKPEPMHRTQIRSAPWEHLAADFWGTLPCGDSLFVLVDYYSRYKIVKIMKSTTGEKTLAFMDCHYLLPLIMVLNLLVMYFRTLSMKIKFSINVLLHYGHKPLGKLRGKIDPS